MLKEKIANAIKERILEEYTEFTYEDYHEIVGWGRECYLGFDDFCQVVKVEEFPIEEITEITLQELCDEAGRIGGEDNYEPWTIDYFVENEKIYKRVTKGEVYRIVEE